MRTKSSDGKVPKKRTPHGTTHKDRATWFQERAVFPLRDAPPIELERAWEKLSELAAHPEHQWEEVGPCNIAGRITSLVVHPTRPEVIYAGSAGGGVWRTWNSGEDWEPSWNRLYSQNIGALAINPREPYGLIAATGEANLSPDTYPGTGIYLSDSSAGNWKPFFQLPQGGPLPEEIRQGIPRRVGCLGFDPFQVLVGAVGSVSLDERMTSGLYLIDMSQGFIPCPQFPLRSYQCHSLLFHPKRKGVIFAALELRGSQNGIWRSEDSGNTWIQLTRGLPAGQHFGRTSLAIAPSDPDVIYALAANRRRGLIGVFRSKNFGSSWTQILDGQKYPNEHFMSYNNCIVVHPEKPDFVIWGGEHLYRTTDAGKNWRQISIRIRTALNNYVHEDQHALVMPAGNLVYAGNDGGFFMSDNGGDTWHERPRGMVTTMFYDIDVAAKDSNIIGGGAQDNGTLIGGVLEKPGDFVQAVSGDGGWIVFDGADEGHVFGSFQNLNVLLHRPGRPWTADAWKDVSPKGLLRGEQDQRAIAVLAIEPGTRKGRKKLWAGTSRLWRTDDDGKTWNPISDIFDGSVISAIEIARTNPQIIFVGTTSGGFYRSTDGGKTWSENIAGVDIPRRLITRIQTHPMSAKTVAITVASTGLPGASLKQTIDVQKGSVSSLASQLRQVSFQKAYSNVFQSDNMGNTWEDIDGGSLPNVVFYALAFETRKPYRLFAGGDTGVFVKEDDAWVPITGNMPNVVVSDLVYHHKHQVLTAATYGRGIWRLHTDRVTAGIP